MLKQLILFIFVFNSISVYAGFKGSIQFSKTEILNHRSQIDRLTEISAQCLETYQEEHLNFYEANCRIVNGKEVFVSKFYGERRYSKKKNQVRPDGTPLEFLGSALKRLVSPKASWIRWTAQVVWGWPLIA